MSGVAFPMKAWIKSPFSTVVWFKSVSTSSFRPGFDPSGAYRVIPVELTPSMKAKFSFSRTHRVSTCAACNSCNIANPNRDASGSGMVNTVNISFTFPSNAETSASNCHFLKSRGFSWSMIAFSILKFSLIESSVICCNRPEAAKMPASPKSSPATPSMTAALANLYKYDVFQGSDSGHSPVRPKTSTIPEIIASQMHASSKKDASEAE